MGVGYPISIEVQQLGGSVTAWCWILVDSARFLAKTIRELGLSTQHFPKPTIRYNLSHQNNTFAVRL